MEASPPDQASLTHPKSSSYHFPRFPDVFCLRSWQIIRLLLATVPLLALVSCASESASRAELSSLRAELHSVREENARLWRRIDQLESARGGPSSSSGSSATGNSRDLPSLTVVKLRPKSDPPPKISVAQPVVEPAPDTVAEILEAPAPGPSRVQQGSRASDASLDAEFAESVAALKTGNVSGGIARLQRFAAQNPRHPKADNALYFAGVGLMAQSDYEAATGSFDKLLSSYPASDEVRDAMLRLAECRARLKNARAARALYTQVVNKYPGSAAASEATQRLALLPP
jgi:tol-pal system protein YbgF